MPAVKAAVITSAGDQKIKFCDASTGALQRTVEHLSPSARELPLHAPGMLHRNR